MRKTFYLTMGVFIFLGAFMFAGNVSALSVDDEITTAFQEMLDRAPTESDLVNNRANFTTRDAIKTELNQWAERDLAIHTIYYRALNRPALDRELNQLKIWVANNNLIREQLFNTAERNLAIQSIYDRFINREAEESHIDFYENTRSDMGDILAFLNEGSERRLLMERLIREELGRDATAEEIVNFIESKSDRIQLVRGLRNPVIVKVTDSLGNIQENSWGVEQTGGWSIEEYQINPPIIRVGDEMTWTIRAFDFVLENEVDYDEIKDVISIATNAIVYDDKIINKVYYKFTLGNGHKVLQDWSTSNTLSWTVDTSNLGHNVSITAWVKDNNLVERMGPGSGDDYTYLSYNMVSSSDNGDATLTKVMDSDGRTQTDSWITTNSFGQWDGVETTPAINVGDVITLTATASDPEDDTLSYLFMFCDASGSCPTKQEWSSDNTYEWTVTTADIGSSVTWFIQVQDDNGILASGDHGDDWTGVTYKVLGTEGANAIFTSVVDGNGNTKYSSFQNEHSGVGDDFIDLPHPTLHVGDMISFTATATDAESNPIQYRFMSCKTGGSCVIDQNWSTDNTYTWTATDEYVSPTASIHIQAKDNNGENMMGDNGDDYMILSYQIWE